VQKARDKTTDGELQPRREVEKHAAAPTVDWIVLAHERDAGKNC
jgi:hypothetical protein